MSVIKFIIAIDKNIPIVAEIKNPFIPLQIIDGLNEYLDRHMMDSVKDLIGGLQV
jgi:hypothetical protein